MRAGFQVYDVRMAPRVLTMLPFAAGPAILKFHPMFTSTFLVAANRGVFSLADAQGTSSFAQTHQVPVLSFPCLSFLFLCDSFSPSIGCGCREEPQNGHLHDSCQERTLVTSVRVRGLQGTRDVHTMCSIFLPVSHSSLPHYHHHHRQFESGMILVVA